MVVMPAKGHNKRDIKPAPVTCNLGDGDLPVPLLISTGPPRGHNQKFLAQDKTERENSKEGNTRSLRKHTYSNILKISPPKTERYQIKTDIFHISAQNVDCGYSLEPPRRGGSNEYPQFMFKQK